MTCATNEKGEAFLLFSFFKVLSCSFWVWVSGLQNAHTHDRERHCISPASSQSINQSIHPFVCFLSLYLSIYLSVYLWLLQFTV